MSNYEDLFPSQSMHVTARII